MKLQPVLETFRSVERVREKADGQSRQNSQQDKRGQNEDQKFEKITEETLNRAVSEFSSDAHAQATGLQASVAGSGPGLKVILTDGSGVVIRQFTGEEFLRMREAAGLDGRGRGKILDQKL